MSFNGIDPSAVPVAVTSITFVTVSFLVVCTRIFTRWRMLNNLGPDDYFMVGALCAAIVFTVVVGYRKSSIQSLTKVDPLTNFEEIHYGLGTTISKVPPENLPYFFQTLWATIPMYNLSLVLTKISIVFQYMRIFTQRKVQRLCYIMIGILSVYGIWTLCGSFFMCNPISYFWDKTIEGHCMNQLAFWFSNSGLNIATDIMVFAFPMPLLKQLQLPRNQKIGLMFIFAFGSFVCITSIVRLKSLYEISISPDTTRDGVGAAIWSSAEINVAISCASLPALKPLISRIFPKLLSVGSTRGGSKTGGSAFDNSSRSHHVLETMHTRSQASKGDEIKIVQTVVQERSDGLSRTGSERSLVWKCDCYNEEQHAKSHSHV